MQASRLTAIAGWLRSGGGTSIRSRLGKRPGSIFWRLAIFQSSRVRVVRVGEVRLVGHQQFGDHPPRGLGAVGLGLDLHAGRRRAQAACREHALALDLDHADAAVAVGAIAGLGRVAQVRQLDVVAAAGAEDRLAGADVDLLAVHEEGLRRGALALAGGLVGRNRMRDAGLAAADGGAARGALVVVAVADWFLALAHRSLSLTNAQAAW